jgi:TadE-like protein
MLKPRGLIARVRAEAGVATVEFYVVALFALLPLCFGILQIGALLVENHHIDYATFMAARQGAVRNGDTSAMRNAFARSLTGLFAEADLGNPQSAPQPAKLVQLVASAYARASADSALYASFKILAPNAAMQQDFSILRSGSRVIPNDALDYRSAAVGSRSGVSLQDANVLRLEVRYCRPLVVPLVSQLLLAALRNLDADLFNQRCYAAGRVPIRSEGSAPMQSDFRVTS